MRQLRRSEAQAFSDGKVTRREVPRELIRIQRTQGYGTTVQIINQPGAIMFRDQRMRHTDRDAPSVVFCNQRNADAINRATRFSRDAIEFKHGPQRIFLGPLAGGSGVLVKVKFTDGNGKVVAHPERIEPEPIGQARAFDQQVLVGLEAEVGDEKAEPGHDWVVLV